MAINVVSRRILTVFWSAILALLITAFATQVWTGLALSNLKIHPAIPWSVIVMAIVLGSMWKYLAGEWWPRRTSEARHRCLRANRVPVQVFGWAVLADLLSIVALSGYWIVLFRLVKTPANALPDLSKYPSWTVLLILLMSSISAPLSEEAGFRGYCQVVLEREFRAPLAIVMSSVLFMLMHLNYGLFFPKVLVYFLAGVTFGVTAYLTNSILPGIAGHFLGDLAFFTLVWPHDAARQIVWEAGTDAWFWMHTMQAILFTVLAILAFHRLARITARPLILARSAASSD